MHLLFFLLSFSTAANEFTGLSTGEAVRARVIQDCFPGKRCHMLVTEVRDDRGRYCGALYYASFYSKDLYFLKGEVLIYDDRHWISTGDFFSVGDQFRSSIYNRIRNIMHRISPDSLLMDSLLLGYPHKELQNLFRACGLSFLLALSGMHLSILIQFCKPFLNPLPRLLQNFLLIILVVLFVWISGFRHSLFRAMLMFILRMFYSREGEGKKNLSLLTCTACIHLLLFPDAWETLSFQLSYGAMAGIFMFSPYIALKFHFIKPALLRELLSLSIGAQAMVSPWICWTLGEFHPFSMLSALLLAPLITIFLWISISSLALAFIEPVSSFLGRTLCMLEMIIMKLGGFFTYFPHLSLGSNDHKRVVYAGILAIPAIFMIWHINRRHFLYGKKFEFKLRFTHRNSHPSGNDGAWSQKKMGTEFPY